MRETTLGEGLLIAGDCLESLRLSEVGAEESGEEDNRKGRPQSDALAEHKEEKKLDHRDSDEEKKEAW